MLLKSAFSDLNLLAVLVAGIVHIAGGLDLVPAKDLRQRLGKTDRQRLDARVPMDTGRDHRPSDSWLWFWR